MTAIRRLASSALAAVAAAEAIDRSQYIEAVQDTVAYPGTSGVMRLTPAEIARYGRKEGEDLASVVATVKGLQKDLADREERIKTHVAQAVEQAKTAGKLDPETKSALEKLSADALTISSRILALEQKLQANDNGGPKVIKSLGEEFSENEKVKAWREGGGGGRVKVGFKAITSITTGAGSAGDLIVPTRVPGIIQDPNRPMTIRQLLSQGRTTSNAIEYVKESGFTNNAAPVAEGTQKPESSIEFELATANVRTIAHWIQASKQVLADVPMLETYINTRLRYGLELVEEDQLLSGDGVGQNLLGLIPQSTAFDASYAQPGDTRIDIVRRAINQVRKSEYRADAIVMHPDDWTEIELTKTTEGAYVWANPRGLLGPTLWGLPVVDTTAVEPGEFMVGAFRMAAQVWDREDANVQASEEDRDNFIKNMVTIRGEERLALTVYREEALIYGDFDNIVTT